MVKGVHYIKAGTFFTASAGSFVYGTGGTDSWWQKYGQAKTWFDKHGNLDGFSDRAWLRVTRQSYNKHRLVEDQIYFLRAIKFDFTEQQRSPKSKGNRILNALRLKQVFDEKGKEGLTAAERVTLRTDMAFYRAKFKNGELGKKSVGDFGFEDEEATCVLIEELNRQ